MIGGQPFWRDIDVARVPSAPVQTKPVDPDYVTAAQAIWLVCMLWDVDQNALFSRRRAERLVQARALATWILRTDPAGAISYPKIGRALGGRDHAGIINLHRMAIRLRLEGGEFARTCAAINMDRNSSRETHHGN